MFRTFTPPGPISQAFVDDWTNTVIGLNGPVGCGKTTTMFQKVLRLAYQMPPSDIDGIARFSALVVRDTYPNMMSTIKTWHGIVSKDIGDYTGSWPAVHKFKLQLSVRGRNFPLEIEVIFRAIGDHATAEDALKGVECTIALVNEADLTPADTLSYLSGRVGRYPAQEHGEIPWAGVLADFNAPNETDWTFEVFYKNLPEGWGFYALPGGLDPKAENLQNLRGGVEYYRKQLANPDKNYVERMVHNKPGFSRNGKAVFPEFSSSLHAGKVDILPDRPVYLCLDQGNIPAALFLQYDDNAQIRVVGEITGGHILPTAFAEAINHMLATRFTGLRVLFCYADPASFARNNDTTWARIISEKTGLTIKPAPSNAIAIRLDAVRTVLVALIDGNTPKFIMDKEHCPRLYAALIGEYRYKKVGGRMMDTPEKNEASNVADALQYGVLGLVGIDGAMGRKSRPRRSVRRMKVRMG